MGRLFRLFHGPVLAGGQIAPPIHSGRQLAQPVAFRLQHLHGLQQVAAPNDEIQVLELPQGDVAVRPGGQRRALDGDQLNAPIFRPALQASQDARGAQVEVEIRAACRWKYSSHSPGTRAPESAAAFSRRAASGGRW